jgi:hypothetical protein
MTKNIQEKYKRHTMNIPNSLISLKVDVQASFGININRTFKKDKEKTSELLKHLLMQQCGHHI